ncbi:MAG TPA: glycine cleavage T C-terminal barrel domain-containing protein [Vicinamibacterales bacterium]|jgi:folate-binding protein YgfZ|nr:glycine cleavage T C-terminal barrel domain-containing protein [Vicinamibacterales bacterium]
MFSLDKYTAAHNGAILIDASAARGKISVTGRDRAAFLHALLTNDIARLTPGTGCYAAYLTPQGRMISDMRVIETGDQMLLGVEGIVASSLTDRLKSLIFAEDVQVKNVTLELAELGVHGPSAAAVLERITGVPADRLQSMAPYDNIGAQRIQAPGPELTIVRDDSLGLPGFDLYALPNGAAHVAAGLLEAGAAACDADTAEVLRIEAGRPRFGVDMDTDTIPLEAGIEDRAISFTKGCYVGQEVIVRVLHRGHGRVARRLVTMVLGNDRVPVRGDRVFSGGQEAGRITSAARSPLMKAAVALGYVQRDYAAEGTELFVRSGDEQLYARVHQIRN